MESLWAFFVGPKTVDLSNKSYAEIINWLHSADFKPEKFSDQEIKNNPRLTVWQRYRIFAKYQEKQQAN